MRDLSHNVALAASAPSQARTASFTGAAADLLGFNAALLTFSVATYTDGTFTPLIQESPDGVTWTNVAAVDMTGAYTVVSSAAAGGTHQKAGYIGNMRFIRISVTAAGTTTGAVLGSLAILGWPTSAPV